MRKTNLIHNLLSNSLFSSTILFIACMINNDIRCLNGLQPTYFPIEFIKPCNLANSVDLFLYSPIRDLESDKNTVTGCQVELKGAKEAMLSKLD